MAARQLSNYSERLIGHDEIASTQTELNSPHTGHRSHWLDLVIRRMNEAVNTFDATVYVKGCDESRRRRINHSGRPAQTSSAIGRIDLAQPTRG
jgi:hypothetical protein